MPTPTYDLLASNVLSSTASTVTFDNLNTLASGYRDLIFQINLATTSSGQSYVTMRFNSDTGSNYHWVGATGNGTTTVSSSTGGSPFPYIAVSNYVGSATNSKAILNVNLMDFATTNKHKSVLVRANNASQGTTMEASRWASTSAITRIDINSLSASFPAGSSFYLYGIVS